jgi:hypothetical protein
VTYEIHQREARPPSRLTLGFAFRRRSPTLRHTRGPEWRSEPRNGLKCRSGAQTRWPQDRNGSPAVGRSRYPGAFDRLSTIYLIGGPKPWGSPPTPFMPLQTGESERDLSEVAPGPYQARASPSSLTQTGSFRSVKPNNSKHLSTILPRLQEVGEVAPDR